MHYIVYGSPSSVFTVGPLASWKHTVITLACKFVCLFGLGGFHLHLLAFPKSLVCQIGFLVRSSFANDNFRRISTTLQHHFKMCLLRFYMKKRGAFTLIFFAVLKWDDCLSVQLPFEFPVQIPAQLLLELEIPHEIRWNVTGQFKTNRFWPHCELHRLE